MKYFALIWEDLSKPWSYFTQDDEDFKRLKEEIETAMKEGDIHPYARVIYYEGKEILELDIQGGQV